MAVHLHMDYLFNSFFLLFCALLGSHCLFLFSSSFFYFFYFSFLPSFFSFSFSFSFFDFLRYGDDSCFVFLFFLFSFFFCLNRHDFFFFNKFGDFFFLAVCHFFVLIWHYFFNKGIWVNLYNLLFSIPPLFHSQPKKKKKLKSFVFSNFSIFAPFSIFPLFHPSNQMNPKALLVYIPLEHSHQIVINAKNYFSNKTTKNAC